MAQYYKNLRPVNTGSEIFIILVMSDAILLSVSFGHLIILVFNNSCLGSYLESI